MRRTLYRTMRFRRTNAICDSPPPPDESVRQFRHPGQQEALDVAARLHVTQADEGIDQGVHLEARDLAGAIEEIVLGEEVVGLLDVFRLLAADRNQNTNRLGAVLRVVEIVRALAL